VIPFQHPHLDVAALTHPGESGKNNEDFFSVTHYRLETGKTPSLLAVVTDGIGGHQAGEVASQLAGETIVAAVAASSGRDPVNQLRAAVSEAARGVMRASQESLDRSGMGSTVAVVWVIGDRVYAAYVGDSRIYLLHQGVLRQLSIDHTWVQEALEHGVITPEEAHDHPHAHVLRRHLGGQLEAQPDMRLRMSDDETDEHSLANQGLRLKPGDQILLCTDGLTDLVEDRELRETITTKPPKEAAQALVDLARERGGFDNITALIMAVPRRGRRPRGCLRASALALATGVCLLGMAAAGLAGLWRFGLWPWNGVRAPVASPGPSASQMPALASTPLFTPTPGVDGSSLGATPIP
jgi:protein phosphatase